MARAYSISDLSDDEHEPQPGEWTALRGELVALLDQVEGRYARVERPEPALSGLAQRVRNLRDQVEVPEPATRRREALRTVKRAVDRFSERDEAVAAGEPDALTYAIAEIRGRQFSAPAAALGRRASDMPEFRELSGLVGGLSSRLGSLEDELKAQRANNGSVREVASQVEQLTHVVELLAGAVGETGQVKRLEAQIAALGAMIEETPKVDLSAVNKRLDDVSATVGKLAELQAQQMEREIIREDRIASDRMDATDTVAPAMQAIEHSVRNVYDRIDAIEKNVALSSGDFEKLTSEMAAFTQAMHDGSAMPAKLVGKVEALAAQIDDMHSANGDVVGLKDDIAALRDAVMAGMEPRFTKIETQLQALAGRDSGQIENQLKLLMARMDETGEQLDGLASLYARRDDDASFEALATLVAERTSDAMTRKAPAPVAMFGPDSLKSIESQITGLLKSASKAPDYGALADMVAARASEAVAKSAIAPVTAGVSEQSISAFEDRMTAMLNTAGKDTAARLARLEAKLSGRADAVETPSAAVVEPPAKASVEVLETSAKAEEEADRLESMLAALSSITTPARSDAMPANPAEEAPLRDPGFPPQSPVRTTLDAKAAPRSAPMPKPAAPTPSFDPTAIERPPRPESSFAPTAKDDPFAVETKVQDVAPAVDTPVVASGTSTSTFVAAARRAQRTRQETTNGPSSNSLIARALARVKPAQPSTDAMPEAPAAPEPPKAEKPAKAPKPVREKKAKKVAPEVAQVLPEFEGNAADTAPRQSFFARNRRPLLLAATLVAVSMLALNLVIQRMGESQTASPVAAAVEVPVETPEPAPVGNTSLGIPSSSATIDTTQVGSINPGAPMSFDRPATEMPSTLFTKAPVSAAAAPAADVAPLATPAPAVAAAPETFELPPEAVGPLELRQAAADGDARAQFEIGAIYTEGRAVEQSYDDAAKWYERAAAQGFTPAQYRLGNLYEAGTGVAKNLEEAKLWYQRSADAGNRMAMHNLAALYASGQLGDQEFESAAEWFTKAANLGMTDSQFNLGMLYARGLGVEQNFETSYKWFSLAARSGDADATKARDDVAKSLTADAVSRVNGEVSGWKAQQIDLAANFAPLGTWSAKFEPGQAITTRDVVSKVQAALNRLGYNVGTPDGVAGPKTAEAITAFESGTGMAPSGKINPRLLAVLGSQPV